MDDEHLRPPPPLFAASESPRSPADEGASPRGWRGGTRAAAGAVAAISSAGRYARILQILRDRGDGMAMFEVAAELQVFDHQISGRFTELARDGLIERTGRTKPKPETGCQCDVWRLADPATITPGKHDQMLDRLGYAATMIVDGERFDRGASADHDSTVPGIAYMRRADGGGMRQVHYIAVIDCPGCGMPLKCLEERRPASGGEKMETVRFLRCGTPSCHRTWFLRQVQNPGQPPVLALVMKHL